MKNNHGLGRFETIIIILMLLVVFAFLFNYLLDKTSKKDFTAMRQDAISFGNAVSVNANFFHNSSEVSLGEAIDEKTIAEIKNPVGKGYCDETESKVVLKDDKYLVTLRCGNYLIDNGSLTDMDEAAIYEIGDWQTEKSTGSDETSLYNCEKDGKEVYADYYDELYFVYKINKDNGTDYYRANSVNSTCKLLTKEVYREKKKIDE